MAQVRQRRGDREPSPAPAPAPAAPEPRRPAGDWLSRLPSSIVLVVLVVVLLAMAVYVWFKIGHPPPKLLVVSLGGLRHDYLSRLPAEQLPFFTQLVRYGAHAEWLNPTFPSDGVATRASLFTGVFPEKNGVFGPHVLDRELGELRLDGPAGHSAEDAAWWGGAVPFWNSAVRQWRRTAVAGLESACTPLDAFETTFCLPPFPAEKLADTLTEILDRLLQPENPYGIGIVHTDALRKAADEHGPTSEALFDELRAIDRRLQQLDRQLTGRQARDAVNLVVVSDGGLTVTAQLQTVPVDELLPAEAAVTLAGDGGAVLGYMATEHAQQAARIAAEHPGVRAHLRGSLPARLRLAHPQREPDLLLVAEPGYYLENERPLAVQAAGGYDDTTGAAPDMRGVLLGRGPSFRAGATVQQANAVDVYPLLATLSHVIPEPHSGQLSNVDGLLDW
ncbi:Bis(5'-adenosyl)-triphosphatase enpp4 [Amphibalanus amphitrite]|uniref:Bis(5'-adenosyl)-triphosphatase enpp4 n=1 Tax=Amphibalanus amphitrite TaxID=1232801 RepID=A0A6A4WY43_AMPAM|nr:Bis(5'-adenosyl)-triphosphatase enpp4 [Amphibalanus amphitrite]